MFLLFPKGAAKWWGGFNCVHSSAEQSSEPGPGDSSSHRQWLHEEKGESECGGGPHQAGHQSQRYEVEVVQEG